MIFFYVRPVCIVNLLSIVLFYRSFNEQSFETLDRNGTVVNGWMTLTDLFKFQKSNKKKTKPHTHKGG